MNKVVLVGNLTRDPELKTVGTGISLCNMSIAVRRPFTSSSDENNTDFFNIVVWRAQADNCAKWLKKGNRVGIAGYIQTRTYEAADGTKRYATDIVADEVEFLTPKDSNNSYESAPVAASAPAPKKSIKDSAPIPDDDLPF